MVPKPSQCRQVAVLSTKYVGYYFITSEWEWDGKFYGVIHRYFYNQVYYLEKQGSISWIEESETENGKTGILGLTLPLTHSVTLSRPFGPPVPHLPTNWRACVLPSPLPKVTAVRTRWEHIHESALKCYEVGKVCSLPEGDVSFKGYFGYKSPFPYDHALKNNP